jgi:hypothetical protein
MSRDFNSGHPHESAERSRWFGLAEIIVLVLLVSALFAPLPGNFRAPWIGCVQDLAHVPLFAAIAWALGRFAGRRTIVAAVMALGVAIVAEALQVFVGRSASVADVVRGACGVAIYVGWDLAGKYATGWRRVAGRIASVAIGAGLPLAAAWPTLGDSIAAWRQFPVLADFSSSSQDRRWYVEGCRLLCEPDGSGSGVGILRCEPAGTPECSIILFPIRRDWSARRRLEIEFTVMGGPIPITLSVRDGRPVIPPQRRFDLRQIYATGHHRVGLDLEEIRRGSGDVAAVDVSAVESFHIIVERRGPAGEVRLHRIWLE